MKKLQKPLMLLFLFCLLPLGALAQSLIKGTVNDENGEPVIGATIRVLGSNASTVTDLDGRFQVNAAPDAQLSISYIGFGTQTVNVKGQKDLTVVMKSEDTTLNDVVVIGYGTMKKKLVTGATVQVKGDDIAKLNTTNALEAMASSSPGVQITQSSSQPGKGFSVTIRGKGTIGNSAPLYVIDGVPGGNLDGINPADIESIDVLKDAASAAIYGARGANGVILVTTKQGKVGK
ncbi:MAG: TonB-dependent receptor plug domain-containing protein, partial [Prevotella sp.]|nr:TonB-dependent receptor plug domain-containing protein [Prevotella sp.]